MKRFVRHIKERVHVPGFADRWIRYQLPLDFDPKEQTPRPLLVLFDGQNLFGDEGSFSGGWHVNRAVDRLAKKRPRPIILGIDHGNAARLVELSPFRVLGQEGRADAFLAWVADHLVPMARSRFHLNEGAAGVLLGGASLGGLAAMYAHFQRPDVFGGALAMSPSFWVDDGAIGPFVASRPIPAVSQIYLDGGLNESKRTMAPRLEHMAKQLRRRGYGDATLRVVIDPRGRHHESSWRRRMPAALRWFYRLPNEGF